MGMTITEKILAAHAGVEQVQPGEFVFCDVDVAFAHDVAGAPAVKVFEEQLGATKLFDRDKVVLLQEHHVPAKDILSAQNSKTIRDFARKHNLPHYFEMGRAGIAHSFLPDSGLVLPGDIVVGADSHTVTSGAVGAFATGVGHTDMGVLFALGKIWLRVPESIKFIYSGTLQKWVTSKDLILFTIGQIGIDGARYKSMEFTGEAISRLSISGRLTMCNMAIEAGGKNGIVPPDEVTLEHIKPIAKRPFQVYQSDADAKYAAVYEWDISSLRPVVAAPFSPANILPVDKLNNIAIDQVYIGSCTNARYEDLELAARVLRGKKVHPYVRLIVIPNTQDHFRRALKAGLMDVFAEAGAVVSVGNCGPCGGGTFGVLAKGERCVSTTNRNFIGRMGPVGSEVYLANPAVAAASAVMGRIASPEEVLQ